MEVQTLEKKQYELDTESTDTRTGLGQYVASNDDWLEAALDWDELESEPLVSLTC